jgi:hypothetical protein
MLGLCFDDKFGEDPVQFSWPWIPIPNSSLGVYDEHEGIGIDAPALGHPFEATIPLRPWYWVFRKKGKPLGLVFKRAARETL